MDQGRALPDEVELVRTTDVFTATTTPPGLRRAHRVAEGVWGRLRVLAGTVTFVCRDGGAAPRTLVEGDEQVIPPGVEHSVEPDRDARFVVDFLRPPEG